MTGGIINAVIWSFFLQGVLVFLAAKSRLIKNADKAADLQNFVLCVEMLIAAIGHLFAFPYKEYTGPNARPAGGFRESLLHALMFNDFYHDTVHQVTRTFHTLVPKHGNIYCLTETFILSDRIIFSCSLLLHTTNMCSTITTRATMRRQSILRGAPQLVGRV